MNVLLEVQYDGTNYSGFQKQQNAMTVQEKLENALFAVFGQSIRVTAASRTDAGVHALGQKVSFFADNSRLPVAKLPYIINAHLPQDISVVGSILVPRDFNPRFDAKFKTYTYSFFCASFPNPLKSRYSVFVPGQLDIRMMSLAAGFFIGRHDFAAFCAAGGSQKTTIREVYACKLDSSLCGTAILTITGNGFLYNMVRIIAGTLYYVGIGKIPANSISEIILSGQRSRAGKTMPPHGLVLVEVGY